MAKTLMARRRGSARILSRHVVCIVVLLGLLGGLSGCTIGTRGARVRDRLELLPSINEEGFEQTRTESRLWKAVDRYVADLEERDQIFRDRMLEEHLMQVLLRVQVALGAQQTSVRILVIRSPLLLGYMLPNGTMCLHTGLLAAIENDTQLAALFGHELAHFFERHQFKQTINRELIQHAGSYSRLHEREADALGFEAVVASGYDPREAVGLFRILAAEAERSGQAHARGYASHPELEERIASYEELYAGWVAESREPQLAEPEVGRQGYDGAIGPLLLENIALDIAVVRSETAQQASARYIALHPGDPDGHFLAGEVVRWSWNHERGVEELREPYDRALALNPDHVPSLRALGLLCRDAGNHPCAVRQFERLLEIAPDVPDRRLFERYRDEAPPPHEET